MSPAWLLCLWLAVLTSSLRDPLEEEGPEVACLDHSDCTRLGHKFGCLVWRCVDHSLTTGCISAQDCGDEAEFQCVKTWLPGFPQGVCVPSSSLLPCHSSCSCCGHHCCPPSYQAQWKDMPCVSHHQCRGWNTGQYCCPDNRCCESLDTESYYQYEYYTTHSYYDYHSSYSDQQDQDQDFYNYDDSSDDAHSNTNLFPDLLNETTIESTENETNFIYENYDDNEEYAENTTVEIVPIDQFEDEVENSVKVSTFYETLNTNSTDEKFDYNNHLDENIENANNSKANDVEYSGSGETEISEEIGKEVFDANLSVEIENFSLEADERELSSVTSVSSLETSVESDYNSGGVEDLNSNDGSGSGSGFEMEFLELQHDISGSGDQLVIDELLNYSQDVDGSGIFTEASAAMEQSDDISNDTSIPDDILTEMENKIEDKIKLDVTVTDLTKHVDKSTKEVAWKSEATLVNISFSAIFFLVTLSLNL